MDTVVIPDSIMYSHLIDNKDAYLKLSNTTEEDIRKMWYREGELYIEDLTTLTYNQDLPLWCKMIFRYRNSYKNPIVMSRGVTNKNFMFGHFGLDYYLETEYIEFFFYIATWISDSELREVTGKNERLLERAQRNCVELFYNCPEINQYKMLQKYNSYLKSCM